MTKVFEVDLFRPRAARDIMKLSVDLTMAYSGISTINILDISDAESSMMPDRMISCKAQEILHFAQNDDVAPLSRLLTFSGGVFFDSDFLLEEGVFILTDISHMGARDHHGHVIELCRDTY
jgi:hypothetical protein